MSMDLYMYSKNIYIYLYILFYLEFEENHRRTGQFVHKNETVSHINVSNKFSIHSSNIRTASVYKIKSVTYLHQCSLEMIIPVIGY